MVIFRLQGLSLWDYSHLLRVSEKHLSTKLTYPGQSTVWMHYHSTKNHQDPKLIWRSMWIYWERVSCQHMAPFITVSLRNRCVDSAPLQSTPLYRPLLSPDSSPLDSSPVWTPSRFLKLIHNSISLFSCQLCSNLKHDCSIT